MIEQVLAKVKTTIADHKLIQKGDRVIVGFSGGPDSVCLLHVLVNLREEMNLELHAVHMNHNIRPGEADEDQRYSESFCEKYGVTFHAFTCYAEAEASDKGITTEEAGREARYKAYEATRQALGGTGKVALAHNKNDQAETILMRLLRGTGPDGLAAMEYKRGDGIVRPLLDVSRSEIEDYCRVLGLSPRIDSTNLKPIYQRNKIRLELIPFLEENYNPNVLDALVRLGSVAKEDRDYFRAVITDLMQDIVEISDKQEAFINRSAYMDLSPVVSKRLINQTLKDIGMDRDITAYHLTEADNMIRTGQAGNQMDFPLNFKMTLTYNQVKLERGSGPKNESTSFVHPLEVERCTAIPEIGATIESKLVEVSTEKREEFLLCAKEHMKNSGNSVTYLDYSKITNPATLIIRTRQAGDYFRPPGMKGRKKIQDYLVDRKIPRDKRGEIPMLCVGNEVLWIPGFGSSENFKIDEESSRVLCLEIIFSL